MKQNFEEISILSGVTQAKIAPERGGLVTSLSINNTEILYLDRETFDDLTKNVRGGIPLLFPNAGPLKGGLYNLPQHGFARRMRWNTIVQNQKSITLQLLPTEETMKNYPFDFELKLTVEVDKNKLTHSMTVINTGDKPMPTAYGTHPYFAIPQEEKQRLITNIENFNPKEVNWMEEIDKPFINPGLIKVQMPGREITIENDPNIFEFAIIWHQAGKNFICIEPWTRDDFALDTPNQSLWIKPDESMILSIIIYAKIIN
jgi:galactose mutarotase-like enzyme